MGTISGCAVQSASDAARWKTLEGDLAAYESRRAAVRKQLSGNPTSSDAVALSAEIGTLNRLVTKTERLLSYAVTQPVSTEPIVTEYHGVPPLVLMPTLKVAKIAWDKLSESERINFSKKWAVEPLTPSNYGVILESQVLDESTPGTRAGAAIGSAIAQSAYIDRSFKGGNNYSATNQVVLGIVGAIAGASFDQAPTVRYKTRYSVRLADGSIQMTDEIRGDPFRLPATACVQFPSLDMSDQSLCTQTVENLRGKVFTGEPGNIKDR